MKLVFKLLFLYLLFLIQTIINRPQIDLIVLGLVIFSLYDTPITAIVLGIWAGFLLGLVNQAYFGFHIIILTLVAYASNNVHRYLYKYKLYFLAIVLLALLFKYLTTLIILRNVQPFGIWLLSTLIMLLIALPLENLIIKMFYKNLLRRF
ncbi:MAG: hypothetical protein ABIK33_03010 [candidate division WOR-3 bacterium]